MEQLIPWLTPALIVGLFTWLRSDINRQFDQVNSRLQRLENRIDRLESRIDTVGRDIAGSAGSDGLARGPSGHLH